MNSIETGITKRIADRIAFVKTLEVCPCCGSNFDAVDTVKGWAYCSTPSLHPTNDGTPVVIPKHLIRSV